MKKLVFCLLLTTWWFAACSPEKEVNLDDLFVLTVTDTLGVRANGRDVIALSLVCTQPTEAGTTVTFATNKGMLVASDVPLENRQATGYLKVAADAGRYIITASVKQGGTSKVEKRVEFTLKEPVIAPRFNFVVSDTTGVRADNHALIRLALTKPADLVEGTTASFKSSAGSLLASEVLFAGGSASTFLRVGSTPGYYFLEAAAKDGAMVRADKRIVMYVRPALPDSVALEADPPVYSTSTGKPTTLRTFLSRRTGTVSPGAVVTFRAFQVNAQGAQLPVGRITGLNGNVSNATQQLADLKLYFDTGGVDTARAVTVEAQTKRDNGSLAVKRLVLTHKK